jgi:hypothetical protein
MGGRWGDRAGGLDEPWRGERRSVSSPSYLNSSASQRLFTAFLVRFAGGGEGIGEKRGSKDSGSGCSGGECSGHEDSGGKGSESGGVVGAGTAVATWFATSPNVVF